MGNFFISNPPQEKGQLIKKVNEELNQFYDSFFDNTYNELNIGKYKRIRDAIGLVLRKFESHDHALAYTGKLVMYIQANVFLYHLHLTSKQQQLLQSLANETKKINLNFVYSGPISDMNQFFNI